MQNQNSIEELHKCLDKLALQSLDLIEELLDERKKFDQSLRDGFFEITRARHVMGSKSVGLLQLPANGGRSTEASAKVDRSVSCEGFSENLNFTIAAVEVNKGAEVKTEEGLRKRGGKQSDEFNAEGSSTLPLSSNSTKRNDTKDPLNWFGVLVPQSLRSGQRTFQDSLHSVCKLASLQANLETARKRYKELNKELKRLTREVAE